MFSKKHKNGDEENQRKLENTSRWEDVKVIIAMIILVLIAIVVVLVNFFVTFKEVTLKLVQLKNIEKLKLTFKQPDLSVTTVQPLEQQKSSNMKITGVGYIPCQG